MEVFVTIGLSMLLVAAILVVVFSLVAKATKRSADRIAAEEGATRRSGPCTVTLTLRDFRDAKRHASFKKSRSRGELLLVRDALVAVSGLIVVRFALADFARLAVSRDGDRLRLSSDKPKDATGKVAVAASVADPDAWIAELLEHGARRAMAGD